MKDFDVAKLDRNMAAGTADANGIAWFEIDAPGFRFSGLPFRDRCGGALRRLPFDPSLPTAVDELAWHTTGAQLAFRSDSGRIRIRTKLQNRSWMDHMAMTGIFGFDLYEGAPGSRRFQGVSRFPVDAWSYESELYSVQKRKMREFLINFPLYSGVEEVFIGLDADAKLAAPAPWHDGRPVVVYGSSITQGGCASRPGMAFTNILSRHYNRPFLNFGFSGSGKGEPEVVRYWTAIPDPALFLVCYEANAKLQGIRDTLTQTLTILRDRHPETPVVVISKLRQNLESRLSGSPLLRSGEAMESIAFQREVVDLRRRHGDLNLYFVDGGTLTGSDWEETTVDGVHPTDLGFHRVAVNLMPVLDEFLKEELVPK